MRKLAIIAGFLLLVILGAYTALWHFWAQQIDAQIMAFRVQMATQGTEINGDFSAVSGFPGAFHVSFAGRIAGDGRALIIPQLDVRSFFLPGAAIAIDLPQGLRALSPELDEFTSTLDKLHIDAVIPSPLPASFSARDLYRWREAGGVVKINALELFKRPLHVTGQGNISLDERLQPLGEMPVEVEGHAAFLAELQSRHMIEPRATIMAGAVLGSLAKTDESGRSYVPVTLRIQKSTLYAGPLRVMDVPPLFWPE